MARYFIIIKRKGAKKILGAIPTKKGLSLQKVRDLARKTISKSFNYRITTETKLRKMFKKVMVKKK